MKKILLISILSFFVSCSYDYSYHIEFDDETFRTTETKEYIIVEKYDGTNGLGHQFWNRVSIRKKSDIEKYNKKDSI